jgi:hypothetical protein
MDADPEPVPNPARRARQLLIAAERLLEPLGRCIYCGAHTEGRVCPAHEPLAGLDPHMAGSYR